MKDKIILGLKVLVLVLIIMWIGVVVIDYFHARNGADPQFCISEKVRVYDASGKLEKEYNIEEFDNFSDLEKAQLSYTYECLGLGYKIFNYNRDFKAIEFGTFFISERHSIDE